MSRKHILATHLAKLWPYLVRGDLPHVIEEIDESLKEDKHRELRVLSVNPIP